MQPLYMSRMYAVDSASGSSPSMTPIIGKLNAKNIRNCENESIEV